MNDELANRNSRRIHAEIGTQPGAPRSIRISGEQLLTATTTSVDHVVFVVRWAESGERRLRLLAARALATGKRPGIGGPRRGRERRRDSERPRRAPSRSSR